MDDLSIESVLQVGSGSTSGMTTDKSEIFTQGNLVSGRSQWPRGLRRGSTAARLLGLWVRIPPGAWMSVCVECCACCQVEVSATG